VATLRRLLYWLGLLVLLMAGLAAISGYSVIALWLLINGAALTLGMLFERWRYKPEMQPHEAKGQPTGERFVDPQTGEVTEVYFDASTGERSYVKVKTGKASG
jgi:hypothetical protein